ncbi:hypothetical protein ACLOJK_021762 [Asimina triloba]
MAFALRQDDDGSYGWIRFSTVHFLDGFCGRMRMECIVGSWKLEVGRGMVAIVLIELTGPGMIHANNSEFGWAASFA